jgi:hypothetical protein
MKIRYAGRFAWVWVLVGFWFVLFNIHLSLTYAIHELTILLPIGVTLILGWMVLFRKGKVWARIAAAVVTLGLWLTLGGYGLRALSASREFRHFPATNVRQIMIYEVRNEPTGSQRIRRLILIDQMDGPAIERIVNAFRTVKPCWRRVSEPNTRYLMLLFDKSGREIHVPLAFDVSAEPPTARVAIQWKEIRGLVGASQYQSPKLYEELKNAGLK